MLKLFILSYIVGKYQIQINLIQALEPGRKVSLWLNMNQVTEKLYLVQ